MPQAVARKMVGVEQEMIIAPRKIAWIPVTSNLNVMQTIRVNLDAGELKNSKSPI